MAKEDFWFFWGGEFSQWYPSKFTIDGVNYYTAEQYMMAEKARLFGDTTMVEKIMSTKDPRKQKQFGRQVKNFDKTKWNKIAFDVVKRANIAKFSQNPELVKAFKISKGREIVEASPYDTIWGIGLSEDDERAWDKENWLGTNWLGEALMEVRKELFPEYV